MFKNVILLSFIGISLGSSCSFATHAQQQQQPVVEKILTQEQQAKLTPQMVIKSLKAGNRRFKDGNLTIRDHNQQIRKSVLGQYPKAIILSCVDSRIPVEDVFDRGIGDLFVARVAGNFANEDILGSMEFATKVAGARLILVLGHEHCGAIKATIDNVQLGNISSLVKNIKPAIKMSDAFSGDKTAANQKYVTEVSKNNVRNTVKNIRNNSAIIKKLEQQGKVKIIGAIYDMDTGQVAFLD